MAGKNSLSMADVAEVFLKYGRLEGGMIVLRKHVIREITKRTGVSQPLVTAVLKFMRDHGFVDYRDSHPEEAELARITWISFARVAELVTASGPDVGPHTAFTAWNGVLCTPDMVRRGQRIQDKRVADAKLISPDATAPPATREPRPSLRADLDRLLAASSKVPESADDPSEYPELPVEDLPKDEIEQYLSDASPTAEVIPLRAAPLPEESEDIVEELLDDSSESPPAEVASLVQARPEPQPLVRVIQDLVEYLRIDEGSRRLGDGIRTLGLRRAAERLLALPLFAPLLMGDADAALSAFEGFRDAMLADLRAVDEALVRPERPLAVWPATPRLEEAASAAIDGPVTQILRDAQSYVMRYRGERARHTEAWERVAMLAQPLRESFPGVQAQMDVDEISLSGSLDPEILRRYQERCAELERVYAAFTKVSVDFASGDARLVQLRANWGQVEAPARRLSHALGSLVETAEFIGAPLPETLVQRLRAAQEQLTLAPLALEILAATPALSDTIGPSMEETLARAGSFLKTLDLQPAAAPESVFTERLPRHEQIGRLTLIAAGVLIPGPDGKRKGQALHFYVHRILLEAGFITALEAEPALEMVKERWRSSFDYQRDGHMHRYTLTADGRTAALRHLRECRDPGAVVSRMDDAWVVSRKQYAERRAKRA